MHTWRPLANAPAGSLNEGLNALTGLAWYLQRLSESGVTVILPKTLPGGVRVLTQPRWTDQNSGYSAGNPHLQPNFDPRQLPITGDGRAQAGAPKILTQFQGGKDALSGLALFCKALTCLPKTRFLGPHLNAFIRVPLCHYSWSTADGVMPPGPVFQATSLPRYGLEVHLVHSVQQRESSMDRIIADHMCPNFLKDLGPDGHTKVVNFVQRSELLVDAMPPEPPTPHLHGLIYNRVFFFDVLLTFCVCVYSLLRSSRASCQSSASRSETTM